MTSPTVRAKLAAMPFEAKTARLPMILGTPSPQALEQARIKTAQAIANALSRGRPTEGLDARPTPRHLGHGAQIAIRDGRA